MHEPAHLTVRLTHFCRSGSLKENYALKFPRRKHDTISIGQRNLPRDVATVSRWPPLDPALQQQSAPDCLSCSLTDMYLMTVLERPASGLSVVPSITSQDPVNGKHRPQTRWISDAVFYTAASAGGSEGSHRATLPDDYHFEPPVRGCRGHSRPLEPSWRASGQQVEVSLAHLNP